MGNLFVYYPKPTLWSNHPFALMKGDWVSAEQRAAAIELRDFLLRPEAQQKALAFGFRPANPDVKVVTAPAAGDVAARGGHRAALRRLDGPPSRA